MGLIIKMVNEKDRIRNYSDILKATSLFGSVQVFDIIVRIVRSKFIAILLGPSGMGIAGLLNSTLELISAITSFGLRTSGVRNVAEAAAIGEEKNTSKVVAVLNKLVLFTGLLGTFVCFIGSQYISQFVFGNGDFKNSFRILSLALIFIQLTSGNNTLLQGFQKYKYLAKSTVIGNIIGLIITIPLYFFWGIQAIVPVLILSNITIFVLSSYYSRKVKIQKIKITIDDIKHIGGNMFSMGFFISVQSLLSVLALYIVRILINKQGGVEQVGLYNAGITIVTTYIGLVLTAMGTDYYPRLTKIAKDELGFKTSINQQAEIAILLIAPIIVAFIIFIKIIIQILYSSKFLEIEIMLFWAISASLLKTLSWVLSYSILAKGDSKAFFWNELFVISYSLGLNMLGYTYYGLSGIGFSFIIIYFLYFIQMIIFTKIRYGFKFSIKVWNYFAITSTCVLCSLILVARAPIWASYLFGTILTTSVVYYSYTEINKIIPLWNLFKRKKTT